MCTEIVHRYGWSYGCSPFFHIQTTMHTVLIFSEKYNGRPSAIYRAKSGNGRTITGGRGQNVRTETSCSTEVKIRRRCGAEKQNGERC